MSRDGVPRSELAIVSWDVVERMVPHTRQHILRMEKAGQFPQRIQLGPNRVGWNLGEVEDWIRNRMAERRPPVATVETGGSVTHA